MTDSITKKTSTRRQFVGRSIGVAALGTIAPTLAAYAKKREDRGRRRFADTYGEIVPTRDRTRGFRYASFGWTGDVMSDGTLTPDRHDGMAVVLAGKNRAKEMVLIRNHERGAAGADDPLPFIGTGQAPIYDSFQLPPVVTGIAGGTTTMTFRNGHLVDHRASLGGTLTNCAGGRTPWGSWLTCEETTIRGSLIGARDHGYVYEVPAPQTGLRATANPIKGMGFMDHEAVAVDPRDSFVYLTEDNGPNSGFYQYRPHNPSHRVGALEDGGQLYMLKVRGRDNADLRVVSTGDVFDVEWVRIDEPDADPERFQSPDPGFPSIEGAGKSGPFLQGEARGAAFFARGEGCWYANGIVYFVDTSGGEAGKGSVFAYIPDAEKLVALFVSPDAETADNPDNITVSPTGGVLVCEDGGGTRDANGELEIGTRMIGIEPNGESYVFAENNMAIDVELPGRPSIQPGDYRDREWAGACFNPFGSLLFVNIQTPGVTFVISGPWSRGPL